MPEANAFATEGMQGRMWDFNSNGTGSFTRPDGEGLAFEYDFILTEGGGLFSIIALSITNVEVYRMTNVSVDENAFRYTNDSECFGGEEDGGEICIDATYLFN